MIIDENIDIEETNRQIPTAMKESENKWKKAGVTGNRKQNRTEKLIESTKKLMENEENMRKNTKKGPHK